MLSEGDKDEEGVSPPFLLSITGRIQEYSIEVWMANT